MQSRFIRGSVLVLLVLFTLSVFSSDVQAQRRRRRTRRVTRHTTPRPVVTNPTIAPPGSEQATGPDGEKIISTADQPTSENTPADESATPKPRVPKSSDEDMQQTINTLSNQVDRLNEKLTQMQDTERQRLDMEMLTRAEQRAESLRSQQVDVEGKLADLQAKLDQVEYQLRPENIEQAAGYGTVHPEEAREARRKQLENERTRLQAQIKILETSSVRLETALRTADAEGDSLRRKIEMQQASQDTSGASTPETRPARRTKPNEE